MAAIHPLRLNPPDRDTPSSGSSGTSRASTSRSRSSIFSLASFGERLATMASAADAPFMVRPLPSQGLDGAFRVHIAPDALMKLGLTFGDICQITGGDGNIGHGIAWQATDKMGNAPKFRPAKMTDTLRAAFGFKESTQVTITKSTANIMHADKVTLTDVTPPEYNADAGAPGDEKWQGRIRYLLGESEAIAIKTTFDVPTKKKLRKRFYVESISSSARSDSLGPKLFYVDDKTEIVLSDVSSAVEHDTLPNGDRFPVLDIVKIGGLVEQVKTLNKRLDYVLNKSRNYAQAMNYHVLLHGYEGTGKSLLLERLRYTISSQLFSLEKDATTTKTQASIQSIFKNAQAAQPSIVLIDEVEELASKDNKLMASALAKEMDKLRGSSVLVVAATRNLTDIHDIVLGPSRFNTQIELPIPDVEARKQILKILRGASIDAEDAAADAVSLRTHGFTGKDLALLHEEAWFNAYERHEEREAWVDVDARMSMLDGAPLSGQVDGSVTSQATTEVERNTSSRGSDSAHEAPVQEQLKPALEDYDKALDYGKVRPTALREVYFEKPKVTWADIGGSEAIKDTFDRAIGQPLQRSEDYKTVDLRPRKGVLLYGPPGCSKTMTAQAVATMYDLNFIAVKGAELISMYVGESEKAIRELFRKAKQAAPCIVFFDEIDAIGSEREGSGGGGTKGLNVLTTLLTEMDGFEAMKNVLVLAATNKPEILDPALLRPGRFSSHVYVGLPNADARREIVEISTRKISRGDTDLEELVGATEGYSGAEIVEICDVAKEFALHEMFAANASEAIAGKEAFEEAFRQVKRGITGEMLEGYEIFAKRGSS